MSISPMCTHTVQYIYLFITSILHVSAHTASSSGRTLVTSTATNSFYRYCWHRQALANRNLKRMAERWIFQRRWYFRGTMRLNERCVENVDVHDMPAKPEMFIHGFIFSEKHYTNKDRNHNPYLVTVFCLCTRSASVVSQKGQEVRKWTVCVQWPISFTDFVMRMHAQRL